MEMIKACRLTLLVISLVGTGMYADTNVSISTLDSAIAKGAVCLDGSAPAYSYVQGSGAGSHSWIIYLEGGGWCNSINGCYQRSLASDGLGGSGPHIGRTNPFAGILDLDCQLNPDFCQWHKLYIFYCDGSSFLSDIEETPRNLTFRGARIFNAMMEEMLSKGMGTAHNAILSGGSAGGLATMLHCDNFRKLFGTSTRVKCVADAGFFIHGKGLYGEHFREVVFASVIETHNLVDVLPPACKSRTKNASLCLFPEYFIQDIQTPLFFVESTFDSLKFSFLVLKDTKNFKRELGSYNSTQLGILQDFRTTFLKTLVGLPNSSTRGMFVDSCFIHGQILSANLWSCNSHANKTTWQAVTSWYYDRSTFQEIDTKNKKPRNCTNQICPQI